MEICLSTSRRTDIVALTPSQQESSCTGRQYRAQSLPAGRSVRRGFTLIELLIGLVVVSVLFMFAMPAFQSWTRNSQIRNAADAIANGIQVARGQAIARNVLVQFVLTPAPLGWAVTEVTGGTAVQSWSGQEGAATTQATATPGATITFNGLGRLAANNDGSASLTQVNVSSTITGPEIRTMQVTVGTAGSVRMCDPQVTAGDPRAC